MTERMHDVATAPMGAEDPRLMARALELVSATTTDFVDRSLQVPLEYYRNDEVLSRERELLVSTPLALVESARLPHAHDFVVRDVLGTSVIITRNNDGHARALVNYCRHRGARIADGCGSDRRFTCPYHAWTYDSDGALVGLPGKDGFDDVEAGEYGLVQLPCEERHGLIWVVLTAGSPPLDGMALIYWIFPNLTLAVSSVGVEVIDILPTEDPLRCTLRHGWMARSPSLGDEATLAGYADLYEQVHAAVRDEDFGMLPRCADGIRNGQHGHLLVGRNEPGVQNIVRTLADVTGFDLRPHAR